MDLWERNEIILLGHRGFSSKYPENTILSFIESVKNGADGIELDVWSTKDGEVIIFHDETLERIVGISKKTKNLTLEEIKSIDLNMQQKIPTLEEVFETMPPNSLINVEIKDIDSVNKTLKIIYKYNIKNRVMISSFHINALEEIRKFDKDIILGLLIDNEKIISHIPSLAIKLSLYSVNLPIDALKSFSMDVFRDTILKLKDLGLKIVLWAGEDKLFYTNNNILQLKDLIDIVIANDIVKMKRLLTKKFKKF